MQVLGKEMSFRAHQVDGEHLIADPIQGMRMLENLHCCPAIPSPPLLPYSKLYYLLNSVSLSANGCPICIYAIRNYPLTVCQLDLPAH